MIKCPNCNSESVIKKGKDFSKGVIKQRLKCKSCEVNFYIDDVKIEEKTSTSKKWIITTAINNTETNNDFFKNLIKYSKYINAELMIVPMRYKSEDILDYTWDENLEPYFVTTNISLTHNLNLLAGIDTNPTLVNPLSGYESFSKGKSLIIPNPQITMKCIAVNHIEKSAILYTTGTISEENYKTNKSGSRAAIEHSFSALIIEEDEEINDFHIRVLNADEFGGFHDLDIYFSEVPTKCDISAIVVGDEHSVHIDAGVKEATFTASNSMVHALNPQYIVRHDVLDFYASNHHHKNDFFLQYKKILNNEHKVETELNFTIEHLIDTTPENSTSIIVSSNHNDHLGRWLQECNPKNEPWNAKLYHQLMYMMLQSIEIGITMNPFELYYNDRYDWNGLQFIDESESFMIHDIEVALHGHQGINGSRGSAAQFSKLGMKTITAHSHTPIITGKCFQIGHSCKAKMGYNKSASSWNTAHCIIHKDGSRQMIFIRGNKWRL